MGGIWRSYYILPPLNRFGNSRFLPLKMGNMLFSKTIARKSPGYCFFLVFFLPELRRFEANRGGKNSFFLKTGCWISLVGVLLPLDVIESRVTTINHTFPEKKNSSPLKIGLRNRKVYWLVVSNSFYFHSYLGKIPILTHIFQKGWFNHQPV